VLGRLQRQFTATTTVTINILRARYYPRFSSTTFIGVINRNIEPVSLKYRVIKYFCVLTWPHSTFMLMLSTTGSLRIHA